VTDLLDTGPLDPPPAAAGTATRAPAAESSRAAITPRDAWRKARLPVFLGLVVVLVAVLRTLTYGRVDDSYLDPRSFGGSGSHALAELLRDHGVDVREVDRPSGGADTTVFLPVPELVEPDVVASAASAGDLVLVAPPPDWSAATGTGVRSLRSGIDDVAAPGCAQPDAVAAGEARVRGVVFAAPEGAVVCYRRSFVEVRSGTQRVTFLGTGELMTNDRLDEDGNAALALRLLTRHPTVEWVYPRTFATPEEPESLTDLLPGWVWVLVAQLVVVALLLAFWRGRRLGPVVVEPLPVVVRAAETVEGRARLYLAARARGRAAEALRAGTRDRLVRALGLAPDASRETLVAAVAPRTRGRDGASLDALLYGPPPPDDATLVRLADDLDSLYSEVRDL
jgi:hypothetical protein